MKRRKESWWKFLAMPAITSFIVSASITVPMQLQGQSIFDWLMQSQTQQAPSYLPPPPAPIPAQQNTGQDDLLNLFVEPAARPPAGLYQSFDLTEILSCGSPDLVYFMTLLTTDQQQFMRDNPQYFGGASAVISCMLSTLDADDSRCRNATFPNCLSPGGDGVGCPEGRSCTADSFSGACYCRRTGT